MVYKRGMRFSRAETLCNELLHQFEGLHFNRDPGSWMNQSDRCSSIWLPILTAVKIILNLQTVRYYTVRQKKIKPELSLLNVLFMYRACGYLGQWVHCSGRRSAIALVGFVWEEMQWRSSLRQSQLKNRQFNLLNRIISPAPPALFGKRPTQVIKFYRQTGKLGLLFGFIRST